MSAANQPITEFHPAIIEKEISFGARETMPFTQATHIMTAVIPVRGTNGVILQGIDIGFVAVGAQSATNYYTFSATAYDNAGNNTVLTLSGTTDTKGFTGHANGLYETALTITNGNLGSGYFFVNLTATPTNAPGTFFMHATLYYQKLG